MSKVRAYCFTINNYTEDDLARVIYLSDKSRYLICGFESVSTEHMQGYVYFKNARLFNTVKALIPRAHIEVARGSPQDNQKYCSKDSLFFETGEIPLQGYAQWDKITEVMIDPPSNFHLYQQYKKTYKQYLNDNPEKLEHVCRELNRGDLIEYLRGHEGGTNCFDLDSYDGEDTLFLDAYHVFNIELWCNNYPPKIRRGYEIITVNPLTIILLYDNINELSYIRKKYSDYIDV